MKWRLLKAALKFLAALVIVAAAGAAYLFYRAMPAYSGSVALPGLSAETRVWRDGYGAPHIFAANLDDAMRALGYVHASERLYQMEVNRRVGQGRIAEIAGADLVPVERRFPPADRVGQSAAVERTDRVVEGRGRPNLCPGRQSGRDGQPDYFPPREIVHGSPLCQIPRTLRRPSAPGPVARPEARTPCNEKDV